MLSGVGTGVGTGIGAVFFIIASAARRQRRR
jgi:hypothetical protein